MLLNQLSTLINRLLIDFDKDKIPKNIFPFSKDKNEYYSLSNINHLYSVFKYLYSTNQLLSINDDLLKYIKEILVMEKEYNLSTMEYLYII